MRLISRLFAPFRWLDDWISSAEPWPDPDPIGIPQKQRLLLVMGAWLVGPPLLSFMVRHFVPSENYLIATVGIVSGGMFFLYSFVRSLLQVLAVKMPSIRRLLSERDSERPHD